MALAHLSAATLADQAYAALRTAIVAGEIPRGERVTERGLAEQLRVSPTPVREALRRLEQDRLIERTGPRSVRVATFGEADLAEVSVIEDTLRALAARLAAGQATTEQITRMRAELDAADALHDATRPVSAGAAQRILAHTRCFHRLLDEASDNRLLLHLLGLVEAFDGTHRRHAVHRDLREDAAAVETRYTQHRRILDAVVSGDGERAERLVLEHCRAASSARSAGVVDR